MVERSKLRPISRISMIGHVSQAAIIWSPSWIVYSGSMRDSPAPSTQTHSLQTLTHRRSSAISTIRERSTLPRKAALDKREVEYEKIRRPVAVITCKPHLFLRLFSGSGWRHHAGPTPD